MGLSLDEVRACSLVYFGDGATSEGDFHEGANLAGVFTAPVVLFCQNNGWAISVPTERQTAGEIWKRAEGYGFPGVRVDGNDVLAVFRATREAAERAYAGGGPSLIEALTYRIGAHSTADDPRRYRDDAEVEAARASDPIERFRRWLDAERLVDEATLGAWASEIEGEVLAIRDGVIAQPPPPTEWMFDWTYADPPAGLAAQRREVLGG
jgi:TPP-dependent pyruvate/acetoin dehydrogenase alpha subunit